MPGEYYPSNLAIFLHSFPRLDFSFKKANSTFNPDNAYYVEALLFWGAVPIVWLLFSLLLFLIYFCYRCCQRDVETKERMPCLMWTLAILALVTCCVLGVGFAGVVEMERGNAELVDALEDANATVYRMYKQVANIQKASDNVADGIVAMENKLLSHSMINNSYQNEIRARADEAKNRAGQLVKDLTVVLKIANDSSPGKTAHDVKMAGMWATIGTTCFFGLCLVQCLILLLAVGRSSKCTLLVYCALGIMTMVLLWMVAGILLSGSVGLSDFCVEPNKQVLKIAAKKGPVEESLVRYYVECRAGIANNVIVDAVELSSSRIAQVNQTIQPILMATKKLENLDLSDGVRKFNSALDATRVSLLQMYALVSCSNIHEDYVDALDGVCHLGLLGAVLMWCSCVATGFLFTILVVLASKAWRHLGKGKGYELVTYEANPYAREPPEAGLSPSSCQFYSCSRGSRGNPREHLALHHRTTPPPAYNCNEFYRTYSDMNHLTDDQRSDIGNDSRA